MSDTIAPESPASPEPAAPAEKTYTEAEVSARIEAAIKDRFKHVPSKDELAELKAAAKKAAELEAAQLSELEKAQKDAEDARKEAEKARAEAQAVRLSAVRDKVASELGIPSTIASLITGEDEDAIREQAKAVAESIAAKPTGIGAGGRPSPSTEVSVEEMEALSMDEYAAKYGPHAS